MGNLLRIVVHSAGIQDRDGVDFVFEVIKDEYPMVYILDEAFFGEDWHALLGNVRCDRRSIRDRG